MGVTAGAATSQHQGTGRALILGQTVIGARHGRSSTVRPVADYGSSKKNSARKAGTAGSWAGASGPTASVLIGELTRPRDNNQRSTRRDIRTPRACAC